MKPEFRPIPITIMDFLAILVAGVICIFVLAHTWVIAGGLGVSTFVTPVGAWARLMDALSGTSSPAGNVVLLGILSLLMGYLLHPIAVRSAARITIGLVRHRFRLDRTSAPFLRFPYNDYYKDTEFFKKIVSQLDDCMGCSVMELPGYQPFSAAKRYLRLSAPPLWEEAERGEAEVRMHASLLLASIYNLSQCVLATIGGILGFMTGFDLVAAIVWLGVSIAVSILLAHGFAISRERELKHTYANFLIAVGFRRCVQTGSTDREDS